MRTVLFLWLGVATITQAQVPLTQPAASLDAPQYIVTKNGSNERAWATVTSQTNDLGQAITQTNSAYTEIATGLNYIDSNGQFAEANEDITILATGGAAALQGQCQAYFPADISQGVIQLILPDGSQMQSQPVGLSYFDGNNSVLFAQLTNSIGLLLATGNQILYTNCFTGIDADVMLTYRRDSFEQDIILHDIIPPQTFNLDPNLTRLQVLTEFLAAPDVTVRTQTLPPQAGLALEDDELDFGTMMMGQGKTFQVGDETDAVFTAKNWSLFGNRRVLVEEVPYQALTQLADLPERQASLNLKKYQNRFNLPPRREARNNPKWKVKKTAWRVSSGVVVDYNTINTTVTNYTFAGDTTYFISGNTTLSGALSTFEGGAVIKFPTNVSLTVNTPVSWLARPYRPVSMLSKDDNRLGSTISGSTGSPGNNLYANVALNFNAVTAGTNLTLQHLRVCNAHTAVAINGASNNVLSHVQIANCGYGVAATNTSLSLWNTLMFAVLTNFTGAGATCDVEHLTVDSANLLNTTSLSNLYLTNSLLVAVTNTGNFYSNSVYSASSPSGVFESVSGGSHYLGAGSPYIGLGTTNINPALLAALAQLTVCPPSVLRTNLTNVVLAPQAPRDAAMPTPGYHYDSIDYVWTNLTLNGSLTLTNGVALGMTGGSDWLVMPAGASLISMGLPQTLNRITPLAYVDETIPSAPYQFFLQNTTTCNFGLSLRFTEISEVPGVGYFVNLSDSIMQAVLNSFNFQDCQFFGTKWQVSVGINGLGGVSEFNLNLTNCLLDRCGVTLEKLNSVAAAFAFSGYNNLVHGGSLGLVYSTGSSSNPSSLLPWRFYDNLFDNVSTTLSGGGASWQTNLLNSHNAYINVTVLTNTSGGDKYITNEDYQTGALGNFYYPTNGTNLASLIHAGSRFAPAAGLYHYTVNTNNVVEGTNTVSIGFHYIAVGANGLPLDTDGDGIPDYIEDANGNGIVDGTETSWTNYSSPNSLTIPNGLVVFTPLK